MFEWGNPKATNVPSLEPNSSEDTTAKAAYRWRSKIQSHPDPEYGVFKDFVAILKTNKNDNLRTLIEAGKGRILDVNER